LRQQIWEPCSDELLLDWYEFRQSRPSRVILRVIFAIRIFWMFLGTLFVGIERLLRAFPLTAPLFKLIGK
jgi:hypothetical protein